jgi:hypothetical protein
MTARREGARRPELLPEALSVLQGAGFSRRGFLVGAGALVVSFSMRGPLGTALAQFVGGDDGPARDLVTPGSPSARTAA